MPGRVLVAKANAVVLQKDLPSSFWGKTYGSSFSVSPWWTGGCEGTRALFYYGSTGVVRVAHHLLSELETVESGI
jgi:hypothetical protein